MSTGLPIHIDASTFQKPLAELALTMAFKVEREGTPLLGAPAYVAVDVGVLLRMSNETLNLLFYINADERVEQDCFFRPIYSIVALPLVRNMIDNLYNITYILEDPIHRGRAFRLSGIKKTQKDLAEDEARYSGLSEWDSWIDESKSKLSLYMCGLGTTKTEVASQADWMTLGKYLSQKGPGGTLTDHQKYLAFFMHGPWREYSALAHGGPEALFDVGMFYRYKEQPFDDRPMIDDALARVRTLHLMRAAVVLTSKITELQAHFHFRDANIDARVHKVWNALTVHPEAKELYDGRYAQLMKDKGILP